MSQPGEPSVGGNQYEKIRIEGEAKAQLGNIQNINIFLTRSASESIKISSRITAQPLSPQPIDRDVNRLVEQLLQVEKLANITANANKLDVTELGAAFLQSKGTLETVEETLSSLRISAQEQKPMSPEISAQEIAGLSARLQQNASILEKYNTVLQKPPTGKKGGGAGQGPSKKGIRGRNATMLDATKGKEKETPSKSPRITFFPDEGTPAHDPIPVPENNAIDIHKEFFSSSLAKSITANNVAEKRTTEKQVDTWTAEAENNIVPENFYSNPHSTQSNKVDAADPSNMFSSEKEASISQTPTNPTKLTGESTSQFWGRVSSAKITDSSDSFAQNHDFKVTEPLSGSLRPLAFEDLFSSSASEKGRLRNFSRKDTGFSKSAECLLTIDASEQATLTGKAAEKTTSRLSAPRTEHVRNRSVGASPLSTSVRDAASTSLSVLCVRPARSISPKASNIKTKPKLLSETTRNFSPDYPSALASQSLSRLESSHEKLFPTNLQPFLVTAIPADDRGIFGWKKSARSMMRSRYGLLIHYSKRGMLGDLGELLRNKPMNVNESDGSYGNALHSAVAYGQRNVIPLLLNHGADINFQLVKDWSFKAFSLPEFCCNAITIAIAKKDNEMLKYLILNGANVNVKIPKVDTALKLAVLMGNLEVTQTLIEHKAIIHDDGKELGDALQAAAFSGNIPLIKYLCDNGADVNVRSGVLGSALQAASCRDHFAAVCLLLQRGAKFDFPSGTIFGSALHAAAFAGSVAIVKMLLEQVQANVHACGGTYGSALHAAARQGHVQVVKALVGRGADVNYDIKLESSTFGTPLQAAALCGADDVVKELLARGANPDAVGRHAPKSPLAHAIEQNHPRVVFSLVDKGAVLEPKGKKARALLAASESGRPEICSFLISKGAVAVSEDIVAATKAGDVAVAGVLLESNPLLTKNSYLLHTAISKEREDLAELFIKHGADINSVNKYVTPLQRSVQKKNASLVQLLLSHGADPNGPDCSSTPPLVQAIEGLDSKVVQILIAAGADPNKPKAWWEKAAFDEIKNEREQLSSGQRKSFCNTLKGLEKSESPKIIKSPIRIAVEKANPEILDILLKHGGNANESGSDEWMARSLLSLAIEGGDTKILDSLLKAGADVVVGTLPSAIAKGKLDLVRCILRAGALLKHHEDVLLPAIEAKNRPLVEMLLEHGAVIEPHHQSAAVTNDMLSVVNRHPINTIK